MKYSNSNFKILLTLCITLLVMTLSVPKVVDAETSSKDSINLNTNDEIEASSSTEETFQVFNQGSKNIYLSKDDIYLMAQVVYGESRGEPYEGKVAVASVILNRVVTDGFPGSIRDVILQPNAFSCVVDGSIDVVPTTECYNAVYDAIYGYDPTDEAVFFYNPSIATCSWMQTINKTDTVAIGQHLFFNIEY